MNARVKSNCRGDVLHVKDPRIGSKRTLAIGPAEADWAFEFALLRGRMPGPSSGLLMPAASRAVLTPISVAERLGEIPSTVSKR